MSINRMMINICSNDLQKSMHFYTCLFDFAIDYESDWFIHLISQCGKFEIGIIKVGHDLVPDAYRGKPAGMYITLVVDDVDTIYKEAQENTFTIAQKPELTFYGQRRLLLEDPSGVMVDVSSPTNQ